jgi:chromosome segregation ATPase
VAKTELLQADLEAMRSKVLAEITEKNKLKEDLKEFRANHKKNLQVQARRYEQLEGMYQKLQQEHEQLTAKCEKAKRTRNDSEVDRLSQLLTDTEASYAYEKEHSRKLQAKCRDLEDKLTQLEGSKASGGSRESKHSGDLATAHQQREIEYLKTQIEKINSQVEREHRGKEEKHKKRGFEETKDLIKKLEETEQHIRRSRRPNV